MTEVAPATLADLEALPDGVKGEVIDGVLYTQHRPGVPHQNAGGLLYADLVGPYQRGRDGPGGWWIIVEPGIEAPGSPEFSPDVAGWRRERLPRMPRRRVKVVPDWLCEVLSPGTRGYDLRTKRAFYARIGVRHLWYVDLEAQTLSVSCLEGRRWVELGVSVGEDVVRAEPFEGVENQLRDWWVETDEE